ncbi:MAG: hypothetical protein NTY44_06295, partial [Deltaproteobacteria bacterium]|nr:hypothetical protein [Deltaproteobacteria bacterium]
MKTNLLILDPHGEEYQKALEPEFSELSIRACKTEHEVGDFIEKARILLTFNISDELIKKAESLHIPAVYDTDDYIFDASVMPYVRAIQDWPREKKEHYMGDLLSYERALRLHRYGVAPTAFLAARMKEKGLEKAFVLPNCLSSEMRVSAEEALYEEIRGAKIRESLNIGFFSGTRTHDADFLVAAAGLDLVLEKN